ncbi:MAG: hypothetical protein AAF798_08600 [Bacteroidota bacterium]
MKWIQTLANYFQPTTTSETAKNLCANCWGHQEWDDRTRQMMEDKQVDVNNGLKRYDFIRKFVVNRIEGIRLRPVKEDSLMCLACESVYVNR